MVELSYGLRNSHGSGNWRAEMWAEIYDRAIKKNKVVATKVGAFEFEYALINSKDAYGRNKCASDGSFYRYDDVSFWIKDVEKEGMVGLNESGLAFVLQKCLPRPDFADYIGLHEHIETLGFEVFNVSHYDASLHGNACMVELEEVFKREPEFIESYADWVVNVARSKPSPEGGYFGRAIPNSLPMVLDKNFTPVEVLRKFKDQLDLGYHLF